MVDVVGVYAIPEAAEPCHLVEVVIADASAFDVGDFTQEAPGEPRANWQVPWDERFLDEEGNAERASAEPQRVVRLAFFFHYLDLARPLVTPFGSVTLPEPTARPPRLAWLHYEEP